MCESEITKMTLVQNLDVISGKLNVKSYVTGASPNFISKNDNSNRSVEIDIFVTETWAVRVLHGTRCCFVVSSCTLLYIVSVHNFLSGLFHDFISTCPCLLTCSLFSYMYISKLSCNHKSLCYHMKFYF